MSTRRFNNRAKSDGLCETSSWRLLVGSGRAPADGGGDPPALPGRHSQQQRIGRAHRYARLLLAQMCCMAARESEVEEDLGILIGRPCSPHVDRFPRSTRAGGCDRFTSRGSRVFAIQHRSNAVLLGDFAAPAAQFRASRQDGFMAPPCPRWGEKWDEQASERTSEDQAEDQRRRVRATSVSIQVGHPSGRDRTAGDSTAAIGRAMRDFFMALLVGGLAPAASHHSCTTSSEEPPLSNFNSQWDIPYDRQRGWEASARHWPSSEPRGIWERQFRAVCGACLKVNITYIMRRCECQRKVEMSGSPQSRNVG